MRAHGWTLALLCIGGTAGAGPDAAKPAPKAADPANTVDISALRADMVVMTDDDGTIYVVKPRGKDIMGPVFVGDGKVFYAQYLLGGGADTSNGTWQYSIWAPRVPGYGDASLGLDKDKKYWLGCGTEKIVELRPFSKKESDRVLDAAEFRPRLWTRVNHLLARDDDGVYYFVDRDFDPNENIMSLSVHEKRYQHGHRVFVGKKGAMKEMPMTNVIADSAGEIYQTKRGDLRIVTNNTDQTATWARGKKRTPLTMLTPGDNRYLIYRELGVYGFMGTACEDL